MNIREETAFGEEVRPMKTTLRFSPLLLLALALPAVSRVEASEIRDRAGMFSPEAVKKAQAQLDQIERKTRIPIVIETIDSIPGLEKNAPTNARRKAIDDLAVERVKKEHDAGVYLLMSSRDRVLSNVLVRARDAARLPKESRLEIYNALLDHFKEKRFDAGLASAVALLDQSLSAPSNARANGHAPAAPIPGRRGGNVNGAGFGVGTLLMIGLGIFAVLILLRALGGLFGRSGGGYSSPMGMGGMPGPGMGPGPGYGPQGYGGYGAPRGGGFFSGMLGGLGGALAGNWLYDQFSGRHGSPGQTDAGAYTPGESTSAYDPAGDAPVGADDTGGMGGSWDDPGPADTGGDWGGGDGGADWGGGGGDWGGGGGDGGGDW
jgi:hypothetical protein